MSATLYGIRTITLFLHFEGIITLDSNTPIEEAAPNVHQNSATNHLCC